MSVKGCSVLTHSNSSKRFSGPPCPLDKTEPQTLQVIQLSYFLKNIYPHLNNSDISKMISKEIIVFGKQ